MPIMALFRSNRVDRATYDAIMQELNRDQQESPGALSHACGFDEEGICVVDVWESRQAFDAFLDNRLRPIFKKLDLEFVTPTVLDAYSFVVEDGADKYKPALANA